MCFFQKVNKLRFFKRTCQLISRCRHNVSYDNRRSDKYFADYIVPQSHNLDPLLFLLFNNDIYEAINNWEYLIVSQYSHKLRFILLTEDAVHRSRIDYFSTQPSVTLTRFCDLSEFRKNTSTDASNGYCSCGFLIPGSQE